MGLIQAVSRKIISLGDALRDNNEMRYAYKHQRDGVGFIGNVRCDHSRDGVLIPPVGWEATPNTFTTEGMAFLLNTIFHDISKAASNIWYVGIFKGNITPGLTDTAAVKLGAAGTYEECQDADYDSPATNKPSYIPVDTATAVITNAASAASFTIAASITVYGAFLGTTAAKATATGTLICAKKFGTARVVIDNDVLAVTYQITASTS